MGEFHGQGIDFLAADVARSEYEIIGTEACPPTEAPCNQLAGLRQIDDVLELATGSRGEIGSRPRVWLCLSCESVNDVDGCFYFNGIPIQQIGLVFPGTHRVG